MKILSVSLGYPNSSERGLGLFIRSRLEAVAREISVSVIAPIPLFDYSRRNKRFVEVRRKELPRDENSVAVFHPRWAFPPGGTPLNVVCLALRIVALLCTQRKQISFDLIDAHFGYPEGVTAALLALLFRRPFTITLRGLESSFATFRLRRWCMAWAFRRAAAVITVSRPLADLAAELGANSARIHTIPNGIEQALFYPRPCLTARRRFGLNRAAKVIVSAGELIEAKGHHLVIQSIRKLSDSGRDVLLVIAGGVARGGRPFDSELHALVMDLKLEDRVRFVGWLDREDLAQLLSAADVFCLASYTEGWPNVVNEALACGTPAVASAVGAVPDMIPSEEYGFVVPPRNQSHLTAALANALDRSWNRAAISAWGGSRSWNRVAAELISVFQNVLHARPGLSATGNNLVSTKTKA
jgi:teichuronic acid biosynthesis glycosyltransferase TuaC